MRPPRMIKSMSIRRSLATAVCCVGLTACGNFDLSRIFDGETSQAAEDSERLIRMGDYALGQGDRATAFALYQQAHLRDPNATDPLLRLGAMNSSLGAYSSAAEAYEFAAVNDPDNADALRGLANSLLAQTMPEQALPYLLRAAELEDSASLRNSLGVAYDLMGDHLSAQQHYQLGLSDAPADTDLTNNMALSLALGGQYDMAIGMIEQIVSSGRANVRHRQNLALVLGLAGRDDEAAAVARIDLGPAQVAANLDYYQLLRSIEPSSARAIAIGGGMGAPEESAFAPQDGTLIGWLNSDPTAHDWRIGTDDVAAHLARAWLDDAGVTEMDTLIASHIE